MNIPVRPSPCKLASIVLVVLALSLGHVESSEANILKAQSRDGLVVEALGWPGRTISLYFLDDVISVANGNKRDYPEKTIGSVVHVQVLRRTAGTNLNIETTTERITVLVKQAPSACHAITQVILTREKPEPQPALDCPPVAQDVPLDELVDTALFERMSEQFHVRGAREATFAEGPYHLTARLSPQVHIGKVAGCKFWFRNQGASYSALRLEVLKHRRGEDTVPARIALDRKDGSFPLIIPSGGEVSGVLLVQDASALGDQMALRLVPGAGDVFPATFGFEEEAPNDGRLAIQVQGLGGSMNLRHGDAADFTSVLGAGGRAVYGFTRNVSGEGMLSLLFTGDAQFDDQSTVAVTSGRVLLGAVLHTGDTYVPYVRGGFGGRLSSYSTAPAVGDTTTELRGGAVFYLGAGVEAWLGDSVVAGVSLALISGFGTGDDDSYSLEGGLHIGYAWKP